MGRIDDVVDVRVRAVRSVQLAAASAILITLSDVDASNADRDAATSEVVVDDDDDDDELAGAMTTSIADAAAHTTIDAYLHTRFEHLVGSPILPSTPGATLPRLRFAGLTTVRHAGGGVRVLPTEHAAFILEPGHISRHTASSY